MTQIKTNPLFNEFQLEIHPLKLTKCGEIKINDSCTNALLFCAFCCDETDSDPKYFKTLEEFIDHIRWHRSDGLQSPILSDYVFEDQEDDSRSNFSASAPPPIQGTDFITDWIAPPEELFELNTISNFIEIEPHPDVGELRDGKSEAEQPKDCVVSNVEPNVSKLDGSSEHEDDEDTELTGEVFIELLNLYKKCPCVWHNQTIATTSPEVIDGVYELLTAHFNKCAEKSKSVDYVRRILIEAKNCFLNEYKDVKLSENDSAPWYFSYLSFILHCDSIVLDKSIFTDFVCPVCTNELTSQDELWDHLLKAHIDTTKIKEADHFIDDAMHSPSNKNSLREYPADILEKFLQLYRSQTHLWNKRSKEYNSRLVRRESYDMLLNILREFDPKATHTDVANRIKCMHSEFGENKKILSSKNSKHIPRSNIKILKGNITTKKYRKPPPQLKVRPGYLKKKVKTGKCPVCRLSFQEHSAWLSHMESAHTSDDFQSKDGFFYCTVCGWQNKTKKLLMRHLRQKHTLNLHKCADCNLGFPLLSMLVEHRGKAHDDFNPFKCETCGDGFSSRSFLRSHSKTHSKTEESLQKPTFLDKKPCEIHTQSELVDNEDIVPHTCDKCGKEFQTAQLLTTHVSQSHDGNNFENLICKDAFEAQVVQSDNCLDHEVDMDCDDSEDNFFRKTSLRKHQRLKNDQINNLS